NPRITLAAVWLTAGKWGADSAGAAIATARRHRWREEKSRDSKDLLQRCGWHEARIGKRAASGAAPGSVGPGSGGQAMTGTLRRGLAVIAAALMLGAACPPAGAASRIKDLANIEGVRQNQLIGYGLVVGLNKTGDFLNNIPFTKQSLQAMLERLGVNI